MTKSSIRCLNQEEKNTRKPTKDNQTPPTTPKIIEEAPAHHLTTTQPPNIEETHVISPVISTHVISPPVI
jgi:hypothetical protein